MFSSLLRVRDIGVSDLESGKGKHVKIRYRLREGLVGFIFNLCSVSSTERMRRGHWLVHVNATRELTPSSSSIQVADTAGKYAGGPCLREENSKTLPSSVVVNASLADWL